MLDSILDRFLSILPSNLRLKRRSANQGFRSYVGSWSQDGPRALQEGLRDRFWSDFHRFSTVFSMIFPWILVAILDNFRLIPLLACLLVSLLVVGLFDKPTKKQTRKNNKSMSKYDKLACLASATQARPGANALATKC